MAAMTRFDKIVLGLTAAFLVVTGGYFVSGQLGEAAVSYTHLDVYKRQRLSSSTS